MLSLIAAIGKNRELGRNGKLLFHIPEDLQFFKDTTMGHPVLMGRKTWESLPGKLKGRTNIVVSRHPVPGADLSITNLSDFIKKYEHTPEEIFVIGGGMVYAELLPYAKHLYITEVDSAVPDADTFFPQFDKSRYTIQLLKNGSHNNLNYDICLYSSEIIGLNP